jgi:hypothetical protein
MCVAAGITLSIPAGTRTHISQQGIRGAGFKIRNQVSFGFGSGDANEIDIGASGANITLAPTTNIVTIDTGLSTKTGDYQTGIRFLGYESMLGVPYNTLLIGGVGGGNTLYLPNGNGVLALSNDVVTRFNGLTGSVTGVTTGNANTFGPVQSFTNGISAAGATFTNISIRNSSNSLTTTITAPSTSGTAKSITLPNRSGTIALEHSSGPIISDAGGDIIINPFGMTINNLPTVTDLGVTGNTAYMLHLNPFEIPKGCTLTRVLAIQGAPCTGHTGSMIFAVYDTGLTNGLPNNLIYSSASVQITKTDYQRYTATPNVYLTAGSYWIGYLMDRTGVTGNMSWGTVAGKAQSWDAFSNGGRLFNNGQMATIRYRLSGFTLASQLTAGFTSGVATGSNPAIGYGNSETYYDNKSPWVGISVQQ